MSTANMTLIGLYNWDSSLFDKLKVPTYVDKDVLVNNILLRSGDFEVLYSDFDFMKGAIGIWSSKWYRTFSKWSDALQIKYDPLFNYDRTEEWTTNENVDDTGTHSESDMSNSTHTENNMSTGSDNSETLTDSTSTDKVSAYNDSTLVNDKQNTLSSGGSTASVTKMESDRSGSDINSRDISGSNSNSRDRSETRTGHAYGNIGVTTSQQMLQSELDIAAWNLYEHITDIFLQEFVIPVF